MSKAFNPYAATISVTEKAIKDREGKIAAQTALEKLALDFDARAELAMETGRKMAEVQMFTGAKKKAAEKALNELKAKASKIDKVFDGRGTDLMLKWQDEIINLESALRTLQQLKSQWDERESRLASYRG